MRIRFITGNQNKFAEAKTVIPDLEMLDLDLPELQEIDPHVIIRAKLDEAVRRCGGGLVVEDTSLYLRCLGGLPGPLIKWFLKAMGPAGIHAITLKFGDHEAVAKTVIGYADTEGRTQFFEGAINGRIVEPRGETKFGWDPIFFPDNSWKTFGQMTPEEKNSISMRCRAFEKLKWFLDPRSF